MDTKQTLIFTYAHLPERIRFLANPPKEITKDKYSDKKYLHRVVERIQELKEKDFDTIPMENHPFKSFSNCLYSFM